MSLEIKIPKEITKYEAKLIGPLTGRQTGCAVLGAIAAIVVKFLFEGIYPDFAITACGIAAVPFILVGFVKIYEMPFEKFAIGYIKTHVIAPQKRKAKIKNQFALIDAEMNSVPEDKKSKYKKSKMAFK